MDDEQVKARKTILREQMMDLRKSMSLEENIKKSNWIRHRLMNDPDLSSRIARADTIDCYCSTESEVNTDRIIDDILEMNKTLTMPRMNGKSLVLHEVPKYDDDHLVKNKFGIFEPKPEARQIPVWQHDIVIVPGVVFDYSGQRIGYGAGYYDRLFAGRSSVLKIALAFHDQILKNRQIVPTELHDIQMDYIVTEKEVIMCTYQEPRQFHL